MPLVPDKPSLSLEEVLQNTAASIQNPAVFSKRLSEGFDYAFMTPSDTAPVHHNDLENKFCKHVTGLTPEQIKESALENDAHNISSALEADLSIIPGNT